MRQSTLPPGASRWPQYLPYPRPVQRRPGPVPNATAIDSPQAQFAPAYLPEGSASFMPFDWNPQYEVLYGEGGIYGSETPRNAQAGVTRSNPRSSGDYGCGCGGSGSRPTSYGGCGCGGYGSIDELTSTEGLDDKTKQQLVLAFAAGVLVGSFLAKRRS